MVVMVLLVFLLLFVDDDWLLIELYSVNFFVMLFGFFYFLIRFY